VCALIEINAAVVVSSCVYIYTQTHTHKPTRGVQERRDREGSGGQNAARLKDTEVPFNFDGRDAAGKGEDLFLFLFFWCGGWVLD
jgi:hypothetical protein